MNYTIVIPTYNRYKNLYRLLDFFGEIENKNFKILILDSSSHEIDNDLSKRIESNDNILLKKYDNNIFFAQKLGQGTQFIDTKYAIMCADDDYIFTDAVERCVNFLEENEDFSLAHGRFVLHSYFNDDVIFENTYQKDCSIENDDFADRLYNHSSLYYPTFYSVHRSEEMKLIYQKASEYTDNFGLSEILPSFISILYGKKKVRPASYGISG